MIIIKLFKKKGNKNRDPVNNLVQSPWHAHLDPVQDFLMVNPDKGADPTLVQMAQAKEMALVLQHPPVQ